MAKLYVAGFTRKGRTNEEFVKIGWTKEWDAMERFSAATSAKYGRPADQYDAFDIKILASAYHSDTNVVKAAEEDLKTRYPKNLQIDESFSGITEIVKLLPPVRHELVAEVMALSARWKKQRDKK